MNFGSFPLSECDGAILAHSLKENGISLRKGTRLTGRDLDRLAAAGFSLLTVARLEADDVHEDEAASRIATAFAAASGGSITAEQPFTGRSNLHAAVAGVQVADPDRITDLNRLNPGLTFACLPQMSAVEGGRMIGTVKIIPYALPETVVEAACALISGGAPLLRVAPFRPLRTAVISTTLEGLKPKTIEKTLRVTGERLDAAGAPLIADLRVPHEADAVENALREACRSGAELLIVFGASATVDAGDVVPTGIARAGGEVQHFGMPVDPGNLLVLGTLDGRPVIGAPGCARSPRENGFDWVLQRLLAGLDVSASDITGMGVGGLLMEIVSRPQPREETVPPPARPNVAALLLAAGRSTRMGGPNKLLARLDGEPLVRIAARNALASDASSLTVVTGHMEEAVREALAGLDVRFVHNPDFRDGLSTSLKTGIGSVPQEADAAIVLLADMPRIDSDVIDAVLDAYDPAQGAHIVVPTVKGKRGNPVLWSRRYFDELAAVQGDVGARHLIGANPEAVVEVELDASVRLDLDTPEAMAAAGGTLPDEEP